MTESKHIKVNNIKVGNDLPFTLIAGPCQMESRDHALMMAEELTTITQRLNIPFIYKSSFDKANRTSLNSKRGIGLENALPIFKEIKETFGCPTLTDIHNEEQCGLIDDSVDVLQIPAFLCRQTDLLIAAAKTGKVINIKKGQFLAPWDMKNVAAKVSDSGNDNIILTDRGTSFGYNTLISDMRGLATMSETGYPVIIDATHSIQQPGGQGGTSGGQREFVPVISRAAIAVGIAGTFMEVHQDPDNAPSDGPCMVILQELEEILKKLVEIDSVVKN
ncbi:MAG: 3-deoxy-8-phosphooctulonate synthase [Rickettsiales bacterium]|nr:3-deoxy-8-phosphooctulonate synthase [Pseudomonadota bacterium]MDA0966273.1 3-deoxy-8-phosphooctulonate synthase [Pseudomonadota bacterium]MDG4543062.1 3-deoxy-8-phosphooctulonate synthase [Rickettsiales bacterium]MDG4545260.1 3-deoxy-8-phosphooctulonate synthase [Rickettsiales bacterium]MDG4547709.1 3-deoxy-8-phosphooctulonate synthase [Rickettsiales bacterium]